MLDENALTRETVEIRRSYEWVSVAAGYPGIVLIGMDVE
jgi:hypothetical protein